MRLEPQTRPGLAHSREEMVRLDLKLPVGVFDLGIAMTASGRQIPLAHPGRHSWFNHLDAVTGMSVPPGPLSRHTPLQRQEGQVFHSYIRHHAFLAVSSRLTRKAEDRKFETGNLSNAGVRVEILSLTKEAPRRPARSPCTGRTNPAS